MGVRHVASKTHPRPDAVLWFDAWIQVAAVSRVGTVSVFDAMNFQHAGVPTGMLFVPSADGISHSPREDTPEEAIREATAVVAQTILNGPPESE